MKPVPKLFLIAALGLTVAACGSSGPAASKGSASASATAFVLHEWSITAPTTQLRAGRVSVTATNTGSETHELVIVRVDGKAPLPTKPDGSVDEDKIAEADKPGEIPDLKAGSTVTKTIDLPPGNYIAICNLVDKMGSDTMSSDTMSSDMMGGGGMGHIHYVLGMNITFTVK